MKSTKINLQEKLSLFSEHWSPKVIAQMNDYQFKLAKVEGDFVWHSHDYTDEVFIILEGTLNIDFRDRTVTLNAGEIFVVPMGVEHKPWAAQECKIMFIEAAGTKNTGEQECQLTAPDDVWI